MAKKDKMTWSRNKWVSLCGILLGVCMAASLVSCPQPNAAKPGRGTITIQLGSILARSTILPGNIDASIADYEISFSGVETVPPALISRVDFSSSGYSRGDLAAGTWIVTVRGRDGSGAIVAQGSDEVTVVPGETVVSDVLLYLQMTSSGQGQLDLTLDWTATGITSVTTIAGRLAFEDQPFTSISWSYTPGGTTARYTATLASGSYFVAADLMEGAEVLSPFSEAVQIFDNVPTSFTVVLTIADFNEVPASPSTLVATGGEDTGYISLSWVDRSSNETHFEIERRITGDIDYLTLATDVRASATTWKDTLAVPDTAYDYRIRAVNGLGPSGYAETPAGGTSWTRSGTAKAITSFSFVHPALADIECLVDQGDSRIAFTLPWDFSRYPQLIDFGTTGILVTINGVEQTSRSSMVDFTRPVSYVVSDGQEPGPGTKEYTVIATVEATPVALPGTSSYVSGPLVGGIGNLDGPAMEARFHRPAGLWEDATYLYVADSYNHVIRRIHKATMTTDTFAGTSGYRGSADGLGTAAYLNEPFNILGLDGCLYVLDLNGIRKINLASAEVSTIYVYPCFTGNWGSGLASDGTDLYFAPRNFSGTTPVAKEFYGIQKISLDGQSVVNIAGSTTQWTTTDGTGDGTGTEARFYITRAIHYVGIQNDKKVFYIGDRHALRRLETGGQENDGVVSTVAGIINTSGSHASSGQAGVDARFNDIGGQMFNAGSRLYFMELSGRSIRSIDMDTNWVNTFFYDGSYGFAPGGLSWNGSRLAISDRDYVDQGHVIRQLDTSSQPASFWQFHNLSDLAGTYAQKGLVDGTASQARFNEPVGMASDGEYLYIIDRAYANSAIRRISKADGSVTSLARNMLGSYPRALAYDGKDLYVVTESTGAAILKVTMDGTVTTVADLTTAGLNLTSCYDIALDDDYFYLPNQNTHTIHRVARQDPTSAGLLAGISGSSGTIDGASGTARFNYPSNLVRDGYYLYIAEYIGKAVRKVDIRDGTTTTVYRETNGGVPFSLYNITVGPDAVYVSAARNDHWAIYAIPKAGGTPILVAGSPTTSGNLLGSTEGTGDAARFNRPRGLWYDGKALYLTDTYNYRIRKLQ